MEGVGQPVDRRVWTAASTSSCGLTAPSGSRSSGGIRRTVAPGRPWHTSQARNTRPRRRLWPPPGHVCPGWATCSTEPACANRSRAGAPKVVSGERQSVETKRCAISQRSPHGDEAVPVAAHVVQADLGDDGEVAGDDRLVGLHGLEADVGHVVPHDPAWSSGRALLAAVLLRLRRGGPATEARHDGVRDPAAVRSPDLEDAVLAECAGEVLQEVAVATVGVLRQRVAARLTGEELPQFHGGVDLFLCSIVRRTRRSYAGAPAHRTERRRLYPTCRSPARRVRPWQMHPGGAGHRLWQLLIGPPSGPRGRQRKGPHHPGRRALGSLARRADVGGLRARSDHPRTGRGRRRRAAPGPADHHRHRRPVGHPGVLLPPGDRRLPDGRRGLRRVAGQLRRPHEPRRRRLAGRRLHADRRGVHRGGRGVPAVGLPGPGRRHHPALSRDPCLHHGAQPARPRRDGPRLPAADAALHRRPAGHHRHRSHPPARARRGAARHVPDCRRWASRR